MGTLICSVCERTFSSAVVWLAHCRSHSKASNVSFKCSFEGCHSVLVTYNALRMHVMRNHNIKRHKTFDCSTVRLNCTLPLCGISSSTIQSHLSHLKEHILKGQTIQCPFKKCTKTYKNKSSFSAHLSRNHKDREFSFLIDDSLTIEST